MIEERLGKPIARIFAEDGEAAFRAAEERITLELLDSPGDPGAGARRRRDRLAAVREALAGHLTVWLDVDPEAPGRAARAPAGRWPPTAARFRRLYAHASRSTARSPTSSSRTSARARWGRC